MPENQNKTKQAPDYVRKTNSIRPLNVPPEITSDIEEVTEPVSLEDPISQYTQTQETQETQSTPGDASQSEASEAANTETQPVQDPPKQSPPQQEHIPQPDSQDSTQVQPESHSYSKEDVDNAVSRAVQEALKSAGIEPGQLGIKPEFNEFKDGLGNSAESAQMKEAVRAAENLRRESEGKSRINDPRDAEIDHLKSTVDQLQTVINTMALSSAKEDAVKAYNGQVIKELITGNTQDEIRRSAAAAHEAYKSYSQQWKQPSVSQLSTSDVGLEPYTAPLRPLQENAGEQIGVPYNAPQNVQPAPPQQQLMQQQPMQQHTQVRQPAPVQSNPDPLGQGEGYTNKGNQPGPSSRLTEDQQLLLQLHSTHPSQRPAFFEKNRDRLMQAAERLQEDRADNVNPVM